MAKQPMGIGPLGAPNIILKRKFRWTFEVSTSCGYLPPFVCKTAERPKIQIEEQEVNFLNAVTWFPGKAKWQPINISYYDVANYSLQGLFNWVATIYNIYDKVNLTMSEKAGYSGTARLVLYDGCGTPLESWVMGHVWPTSIGFGDLDYASSDFCTIDLTLRYSEVEYTNLCGNNQGKTVCCKGC